VLLCASNMRSTLDKHKNKITSKKNQIEVRCTFSPEKVCHMEKSCLNQIPEKLSFGRQKRLGGELYTIWHYLFSTSFLACSQFCSSPMIAALIPRDKFNVSAMASMLEVSESTVKRRLRTNGISKKLKRN